jgi:activator of Hsp90 ATPase-like protein
MSFTTTITVEQSPDDVYAAINDVRSWWTGEITGPTDELGAEFTYVFEDKHRSTHRITELVPGKRVVWLVTDAFLPFASDPTEWNGTEVVFDITPTAAATELRFTHQGLVPVFECYESCSNAWGYFVTATLRERIASGPGVTP